MGPQQELRAPGHMSLRSGGMRSALPRGPPRVRHAAPLRAARVALAAPRTQIVGGAIGDDFINLWVCAMLVSAVMLLTRCLSASQARRSIDWEIYVCIAFAFGVGAAMEKTGVANAIAAVFVALSECAHSF
jgi:di/tricarboxylate transporter